MNGDKSVIFFIDFVKYPYLHSFSHFEMKHMSSQLQNIQITVDKRCHILIMEVYNIPLALVCNLHIMECL